jgi:hypothetical protein
MDREDLIQSLGNELCSFCPWMKDTENKYPCVCGRNYCDEALDDFLEENQQFMDDYDD